MFLIGLPEEARVVESSSQHPFVTVPDQAFRITVRIQHSEKIRQQSALRILNGEIFLVIAHYRD